MQPTSKPIIDAAEGGIGPATGSASANRLRQRRRASIGSMIGTTIEWYEYYIYGATAALVFPHLFFPAQNRLVSLMLSFASFAVAFAIRPIGAAIFGHFGDRVGRKTTLIVTLTMSGLATFLIGILPTYRETTELRPGRREARWQRKRQAQGW
jgi:MFS family permease